MEMHPVASSLPLKLRGDWILSFRGDTCARILCSGFLCASSFSLFHTLIKPQLTLRKKFGEEIDLIIHLGFQTEKEGKALLPRLSFDARKLKFIGVHFPKKEVKKERLNFPERVATFTWE